HSPTPSPTRCAPRRSRGCPSVRIRSARRDRIARVLNVRLLGTGSPPPNPKRRGPATLITLGAEHFLVDAGSGVGTQLVQAGVRPYDWPRGFITHHHSDHGVDLPHLLVSKRLAGQT